MPVIALASELGLHEAAIAEGLARRLGLRIADQTAIEDRVTTRLMEHEAAGPMLAGIRSRTHQPLSVPGPLCRRLIIDEIEELAAYGNVVLLGVPAVAILADSPHVVRVLLRASRPAKIRELALLHPRASMNELCHIVDSNVETMALELAAFNSCRRIVDHYDCTMDISSIPAERVIDAITMLVGVRAQNRATARERIDPAAPNSRHS